MSDEMAFVSAAIMGGLCIFGIAWLLCSYIEDAIESLIRFLLKKIKRMRGCETV